jgi:hypothetical protein
VTSLKQIEANRRNAAKSTGPRTKEGKSVSKLNALRHGLFSQEVLVSGEDPSEFESLHQQLETELQPEGALESQLVERVAACMWRLRRLYRVEAGVFAFERFRAKLEVAQDDANAYEEVSILDRPYDLIITDEDKHDEALARERTARKSLRKLTSTVGAAFISDAHHGDAFSKLSRYEAAIERSFYRALHELQRLQAARKGDGISAPVAVDLSVDMGPSPTSNEG